MRIRQRALRGSMWVLAWLALLAVPAQATTILVLGDSISAGYGIQREHGWVALLADRLGTSARVINASVSGETTGGGVARLQKALDTHHPDIVIIELGGNDGLRGYPLPRIRANIEALVDAVRAAEATPLLVGMHIPPNYGERYTQGFHAIYRDVAAQRGIAWVPFLLDGVATDPELMQADGIHPVAAAQPLLLDNLWPALQAVLDPATPPSG